MPRLPRVSGQRVVAALERLGFGQVRRRGSQIVMTKPPTDAESRRTCVVPNHAGLAEGTLRGVLRQAGVSREKFLQVL